MSEIQEFTKKTETANVIPVVETIAADMLTPLVVYLKLSANTGCSFLLESVEGGERLARYSFIGSDPVFTAFGNGKHVRVERSGEITEIESPMISFLRDHFANYTVYDDGSLPGFTGGAICVMDFACAQWLDPGSRKNGSGEDGDAVFSFYRSVVVFDHAKQVIQIISLVFTDECDGDTIKLGKAFEKARSENASTRALLENGEVLIPDADGRGVVEAATSNWKQSGYERSVMNVKELISAGEAYQVVISQCFSKRTKASPVAIYRAIRSLNPSPYMFLIRNGETSVIGASPEMLVRLRDRKLEYRPIAGTRPRGKSPEEDAALAEEMKADMKEVAEHLMLVDLGRNDLGRVAEYGSVNVDTLMRVEKYSHVQHLVSDLSAELRAGLDRFDALASCFPAGTVSGAPKVRAIEIINSLEPSPRGVYAGTVGYFDYAGNMDTCIAIRTLVLENGLAKVQAGAGIVADSVPELEYQETFNKAKAMLRAVEMAETSSL